MVSVWPGVLAAITKLQQEKPVRHLVLVGKVYKDVKRLELAIRCAWCRRWETEADYIAAHKYGARVSHGMCRSCARKFEADYNALPTDPPHAA